MRFTHEGMTLWTGTQDAPSPGESVTAGETISIMIGVQPVNASNQVGVRYRVNEEPPKTVSANWIRNDLSGKAQYFKAQLPAFQEGDTVQYSIVCHCVGRQIPPPADAHEVTASFQVITPVLKQAALSSQQTRISPRSASSTTRAIEQGASSRVDDRAVGKDELGRGVHPISTATVVNTGDSQKSQGSVNERSSSGGNERVNPMSPAAASVLTLKHAILGGGHTAPIERLAATERKALDVALNTRLAEEISHLAERLGPKVAGELKAARPYYSAHRDLSLAEALKAVLEKSRGQKLTETEREKIDASLEEVAGAAERVADVLELDVPIGDNPLLEETLERFLIREIGRIAGFDDQTLDHLEKEEVNLTRPGGAGVDHLVTREVITEDEGRTLSYLGALSRLSGSNLTLVKALHGDERQSVRDFITWGRSDWEKLIKDNRIAVPEGEKDASDYAESLVLAMERSFPSDYFAVRIAKEGFDAEIKLVDEIIARKKDGAALIRDGVANETAVNTKGLSDEARKELEGRLADFDRFAKTYRHLGIPEIVNDDRLKPGEKSHLIERRLGGLKVFFDNNSNIDIYVADFVDNTIEFDWKNVDTKERPHIKAQLRAMQRISVLTDDATTSLNLLKAGFSSSAEITAVSEAEFLQASGLDQFDGKPLYARAYENTLSVSHLYEGIREASSGVFDQLRVANTPNLVSALSKLDGYTDLFGGEKYCNCEHCRSLLSPSAYFVDLMKFINDNVSKNIPGPPEDNTQILLEERRPDLWTLDLTCKSAKTELPYLEIVNEVLTTFLIESDLNEFG